MFNVGDKFKTVGGRGGPWSATVVRDCRDGFIALHSNVPSSTKNAFGKVVRGCDVLVKHEDCGMAARSGFEPVEVARQNIKDAQALSRRRNDRASATAWLGL